MRLLSLLVLLLLLPAPRTSCERDAQRIRDRNEEMRKQAKRSPVRVCGGPRVCVCVCVCVHACACVWLQQHAPTQSSPALYLLDLHIIRPALAGEALGDCNSRLAYTRIATGTGAGAGGAGAGAGALLDLVLVLVVLVLVLVLVLVVLVLVLVLF